MELMEHRWGERVKVALPVRIHAACGLVGSGLVIDFSVSGALIATTLPVTLLSQVQVAFRAEQGRGTLHDTHRGRTFAAQVVRRNSAGFAVEWFEFGSEDVITFAVANRAPTQITPPAAQLPAVRSEMT
jgi:hypothetical protein